MDDVTGSEELTLERHRRQHKLKRGKLYCGTPEGVEITAELLLQPLIDFLKDKDNPPPLPPDELNDRLGRLADPYPTVALAILAPVLDAIARGWEGHDDDSWGMLLAKQMGGGLCDWLALKETEMLETLAEAMAASGLIPGRRRGPKSPRRYLHSDWSSSECVEAGDWMLKVALRLPCFAEDEKGRPCIAPDWQDRVDKICDDLLYRHPVMLPHRSAPKPWAGWWANHGDRLRTSFVRDWRPETRKAIEATFEAAKPPATPISGPFAELSYSLPFAHADGADALKRVPLRINQSLLPLVDKFAVELMDHKGDKRRADRKTVKADLRHAEWAGNDNIFLDYNCDRRSRVYSIQQLNYAREDHVRALFKFERGEPLGDEGLSWLEIHAANCGPGEVDKKPWADRLRWAKEKTDLIERVADDPLNNFHLWRDADKPFAFVAACQELVRARKNLSGFITHLPIGFDGTCNGIQHLALLARDEEAARLVNLTGLDIGWSVRYPTEAEYRSTAEPAQRAIRYRQAGSALLAALKQKDAEAPQDIYLMVTRHIMSLLENEDGRLRTKGKEAQNSWCFGYWRELLHDLDERQRRKLFKNPIMTFPYSVTVDGIGDKIVEFFYSSAIGKVEPWPSATRFLARAVKFACQDVLPGPVRIMNYIRALARHRSFLNGDRRPAFRSAIVIRSRMLSTSTLAMAACARHTELPMARCQRL